MHVYTDLSDVRLCHASPSTLGILPDGWPAIRRVESRSATADTDIGRIHTDLLQVFADVFVDEGLRHMSGVPMDIQLQAATTPACVHLARPVQYAFHDQLKQQLSGMVNDQIIEPVSDASEWCHLIVVVGKKELLSEKRLTVDFKNTE